LHWPYDRTLRRCVSSISSNPCTPPQGSVPHPDGWAPKGEAATRKWAGVFALEAEIVGGGREDLDETDALQDSDAM